MPDADFHFRRDLALIHHLGFGFHADACAPGILALLADVRERNGLVVELGCGSGLLTKKLIDGGLRVIATDASPAMLELAEAHATGAEQIRRLTLPHDPIPDADAVVSIGHVLSYLPDAAAIDQALVAAAEALRPGGLLALDLCDFEYGEARHSLANLGQVTDTWAVVTRFSCPSPDRFVREMTTFTLDDGVWRRDDERHDNVLVDTSLVPASLARHGVNAEVRPSFGDEKLPVGLKVVVGRRAT